MSDSKMFMATAKQLLAFVCDAAPHGDFTPNEVMGMKPVALRMLRNVADAVSTDTAEACSLLAANLPNSEADAQDTYMARAAVYGHADSLAYVESDDCLPSVRAAYERELADFNADRD